MSKNYILTNKLKIYTFYYVGFVYYPLYKINILQMYTKIFHVNFFIQNKKDKNFVDFEHIRQLNVRRLSNVLLKIINLIWHHKYNKK